VGSICDWAVVQAVTIVNFEIYEGWFVYWSELLIWLILSRQCLNLILVYRVSVGRICGVYVLILECLWIVITGKAVELHLRIFPFKPSRLRHAVKFRHWVIWNVITIWLFSHSCIIRWFCLFWPPRGNKYSLLTDLLAFKRFRRLHFFEFVLISAIVTWFIMTSKRTRTFLWAQTRFHFLLLNLWINTRSIWKLFYYVFWVVFLLSDEFFLHLAYFSLANVMVADASPVNVVNLNGNVSCGIQFLVNCFINM